MTIIEEMSIHRVPAYMRAVAHRYNWQEIRLTYDGFKQYGQDECPNCGADTDQLEILDISVNRWSLTDAENVLYNDGRGERYYVTVWACCYTLCTEDNPHHVRLSDDSCSLCGECRDHCSCDSCSDCGDTVHNVCGDCGGCENCCNCGQDDDEDEGCQCDIPHINFRFPADGHGTITQDERLTVDLPKGTIDEEGLRVIEELVIAEVGWQDEHAVHEAIMTIGPLWQTKRGNFTRRLSSALHKLGIKITATTLTEVGNRARQHSSDSASWKIEFTRDLNMSAGDFYHEESCWFTGGSYGESRCCLKNWGGLAIRTFAGRYNGVSGRAWVQPITSNLTPTHDTINAHAYMVYNGYGDLEGYVAARIVAHLTGLTYRKVGFYAGNQYINGEVGYLVADEVTSTANDRIRLTGGNHDKFDCYTITRSAS